MSLVVNILKLLIDKLRVDLSRRYIRMSEHFLNGMEVGTVFKQMRRKRVPQGVRSYRLFYVSLLLI